MKKIFFLLFILSFIFSFAVCIASAAEQTNPKPSEANVNTPVELTNPLTGEKGTKGPIEIPTLLGRVINAVLGIVGSLALVMFIYGGVIWMTSSGSSEQVTKGKNIIIWATIGLVVIFSAYAIVNFVLSTALGIK